MTGWRRAVVLAAGLLVAGCAQPGGPTVPGDGAGSWRQLPPPPLSPRQLAVTAWTGTEALFIGGDVGGPCPQNVVCDRESVPARDGAAYDPARNTWRRIADPPVPVGVLTSTAVIGDVVYVVGHEASGAPGSGPGTARLLSYDASEDTWAAVEPPPGGLDSVGLATDGAGVLTVRSERRAGDPADQRYDPATRAWAPVPEDPLVPGFDRFYVNTPAGLVLTAKELVPDPGVTPSFVRAAVLDAATQRWSVLPDSEQVGGWRWTWTGRRMVDTTLGTVDGGQENPYDRSYPLGGVLDPFAGEWAPLPNAPAAPSGGGPGLAPSGWPVDAVGGRFSAVDGRIYDDRAETWTVLTPPDAGPTLPGSGVWAGEQLVVLGGVDYGGGENGELSGSAWLYNPAQMDDPGVTSPPAEHDIVGDWAFVDGTSGGAPIPLPDHGRATLSADGTRLTGTAFCNGYGGRYQLDGDLLRAEEIAQTEMACLEPLQMEAESAFLGVLTAGPLQVTRTADELVLQNDQGSLRFRPQTPVPTAELVGTRWTLETLVDGEVASSTVGDPAVLELSDDGTFTAGTGCRTLSGRWQASGDTVTLDYGWAGPACPPDVDAQEQHVIAVLGNGFRAEIDGDRLTLAGGGGQGLVYRAG